MILPDPPMLGDVAHVLAGDIGNTAEAYAHAYYDVAGYRGVTVNPLMGEDSIRPFLMRSGRRVLVPISIAWGTGLAEAVIGWTYRLSLEHPPGMIGILIEASRVATLGVIARGQVAELRSVAPGASDAGDGDGKR
jgi:orotidine-5'-phosphate decarboxylase